MSLPTFLIQNASEDLITPVTINEVPTVLPQNVCQDFSIIAASQLSFLTKIMKLILNLLSNDRNRNNKFIRYS